MITDKNSFKILQILPHQVICLLNDGTKYIFRDYPNLPYLQKRLELLQKTNHPNYIGVKSIKVAETIGVYFQHFSASLSKIVGSETHQYEENQIINTFKEIIDVVDVLVKEGILIQVPELENIVVTENQQIKYVDSLLLVKNTELYSLNKTNATSHQIYEGVSNLMFELLFPKQKCEIKSWKSRLKMLKRHLSDKNYSFFLSIYNKSLLHSVDPSKTKKIEKKAKIQKFRPWQQKPKKVVRQTNHEGKQNKISQQ